METKENDYIIKTVIVNDDIKQKDDLDFHIEPHIILYNKLVNKINNYDDIEEEHENIFNNIELSDMIKLIGIGKEDLKLLSLYLMLNKKNITSNEFILLKLLLTIRKQYINTNENINFNNVFNSIDKLIDDNLIIN